MLAAPTAGGGATQGWKLVRASLCILQKKLQDIQLYALYSPLFVHSHVILLRITLCRIEYLVLQKPFIDKSTARPKEVAYAASWATCFFCSDKYLNNTYIIVSVRLKKAQFL